MVCKDVIGDRLRCLREEKGLTIKQVADACDLSCSTIRMYESGHRVPRDGMKLKLAKLYTCDVDSVFYVETSPDEDEKTEVKAMKISIKRIGKIVIADIKGVAEVKDYKIISSAEEGTELTVTIKIDSEIGGIDLSANT